MDRHDGGGLFRDSPAAGSGASRMDAAQLRARGGGHNAEDLPSYLPGERSALREVLSANRLALLDPELDFRGMAYTYARPAHCTIVQFSHPETSADFSSRFANPTHDSRLLPHGDIGNIPVFHENGPL